MGRFVIVVYMPKPGKEEMLLSAIRDHLTVLQEQSFVTERAAYVMRAKSGAYVEVFEWASAEAIAQAHSNSAVHALWGRFAEACDYQPLTSLEECGQMFAEFEAVIL